MRTDLGTAESPQQPSQLSVLYEAGFEPGVPEGWDLDPDWAVDQEGANGVLRGRNHSFAYFRGDQWSDFVLTARLKLERGMVHVNYRTSGCFRYFIGLSADSVTLSRTRPCGSHPQLRSSTDRLTVGNWHVVEIKGTGGHIQVALDGKGVIDHVDPEPILSGSFSFESLDDTEVVVDWVKVTGKAPPTLDASWVRTGGPLGGLGYDVRMQPGDPASMYVTDAFSGVHLSTDGGTTWYPSNAGITTRAGESGDAIPIFSLTVDPRNPNIVWAGTQGRRGVFKSADGGASWVEKVTGIVETSGITFRGFAVDPTDSEVVYGAAELSSFVWAGEARNGREFDMTAGVVYKTVDGGERWEAVWRGSNLARYVLIDPTDAGVLYLSTGIFDREAANSVPASRTPGGEGVLKSVDGGRTWQPANAGLGNLYVGSLFMHPRDSSVLLAGTGNIQYEQHAGVYLTTDGGETWRQTLDRAGLVTSVEYAESDPRIAYAAGPGAFFRSADGGQSWTQMSPPEGGWGAPGVRAGFPIDLQVSPADADTVFANNYGGGNFLSRDGGRTWVASSTGYTGAQARAIAVDPDSHLVVVAAARSGVFCSGDGGSEWTGLGNAPGNVLEWNAIAIDPGNGAHLLAANNWNSAILESRDRGATWTLVTGRLPHRLGWRVIEFAPSDPAVVYAGTGGYFSAGSFDNRIAGSGVSVSLDGGQRWRPANDFLSLDAHVAALAISPRDPGVVLAATTNKGVLGTADGGRSWRQLNSGLTGPAAGHAPSVLSVAIHPAEPGVYLAGLEAGGLYRSTDAGATWAPAGKGLSFGASISDILFDPVDPRVVYVSDRNSGVFRSNDGGETWFKVTTGLRTRAVTALAVARDGGTVYAATEGEGVFRLDVAPLDPGG